MNPAKAPIQPEDETGIQWSVELPSCYCLQAVLHFHSRDPLALSESIVGQHLRKGLMLAGQPVVFETRFEP